MLSWYETINLEILKSLRTTSPWTTDPAKIQERKKAAYDLANWAQTRYYIDGPVSSEDEYADSGDDDDDEMDEEIDANAKTHQADKTEQTAPETAANPTTTSATGTAPASRPSSVDPTSSNMNN